MYAQYAALCPGPAQRSCHSPRIYRWYLQTSRPCPSRHRSRPRRGWRRAPPRPREATVVRAAATGWAAVAAAPAGKAGGLATAAAEAAAAEREAQAAAARKRGTGHGLVVPAGRCACCIAGCAHGTSPVSAAAAHRHCAGVWPWVLPVLEQSEECVLRVVQVSGPHLQRQHGAGQARGMRWAGERTRAPGPRAYCCQLCPTQLKQPSLLTASHADPLTMRPPRPSSPAARIF